MDTQFQREPLGLDCRLIDLERRNVRLRFRPQFYLIYTLEIEGLRPSAFSDEPESHESFKARHE